MWRPSTVTMQKKQPIRKYSHSWHHLSYAKLVPVDFSKIWLFVKWKATASADPTIIEQEKLSKKHFNQIISVPVYSPNECLMDDHPDGIVLANEISPVAHANHCCPYHLKWERKQKKTNSWKRILLQICRWSVSRPMWRVWNIFVSISHSKPNVHFKMRMC